MEEYANGGATQQEQYYGLSVSKTRVVLECTFGQLKARFRALKRPMDINLVDLPHVIYVCFVLHNYCEEKNEMIDEKRITAAIQYN